MNSLTFPIPRHFLLPVFLFLAGCMTQEQKKTEEIPPVRVQVKEVRQLEYKVPVRATGLLGTATEMKLSFKTGGIVKQIHAREGRAVKRGELLAVLDLSEVQAQVNQARIGLDKARRDMERAGNLYRDSVATLEQYQNARSAYELAVAQDQIADFNLKHSRILAPADGRIQKILVETNELIAPGYPAILFASTENDWVVRAALTDKDVVKFSIGDSARIHLDAFPGITFKAEITELGTIADPVTGTYEVELLILEDRPQFRTGFIARAEIYPTWNRRSLVVPVEALMNPNDQYAHVFVYSQGSVRRRNVMTGELLDSLVVVLEGLEKGEQVITEGAGYLKDGAEVELVVTPERGRP